MTGGERSIIVACFAAFVLGAVAFLIFTDGRKKEDCRARKVQKELDLSLMLKE
jgi:hypothetical protein